MIDLFDQKQCCPSLKALLQEGGQPGQGTIILLMEADSISLLNSLLSGLPSAQAAVRGLEEAAVQGGSGRPQAAAVPGVGRGALGSSGVPAAEEGPRHCQVRPPFLSVPASLHACSPQPRPSRLQRFKPP